MTPTMTRLLDAIETATTNGLPFWPQWNLILELAAKVREEANAVPQEDVAGRMERE